MTSALEGEGGVGQKMTCDDMMTQGGEGVRLMTKYPLFTEILGKPLILNTFKGSYIKPKHRKGS